MGCCESTIDEGDEAVRKSKPERAGGASITPVPRSSSGGEISPTVEPHVHRKRSDKRKKVTRAAPPENGEHAVERADQLKDANGLIPLPQCCLDKDGSIISLIELVFVEEEAKQTNKLEKVL